VKLIRTVSCFLIVVLGAAACIADAPLPAQSVQPSTGVASDLTDLRRDAERDMADALRLRQPGTADSLNASASAFEHRSARVQRE